MTTLKKIARGLAPLAALATLVAAMGGTWAISQPAYAAPPPAAASPAASPSAAL